MSGVERKVICVIGAGVSGLTAIKQCLDQDLDVICYERTDNFGGIWRYRDESIDGVSSVTKSTVLNTSKELTAFSDFPPPDHFPNYMPHEVMCSYLELYIKEFGLFSKIKFNHKVMNVTPNYDYEETAKWRIIVEDIENTNTFEKIFDGVMVCTGHHVKPQMPSFPDQDKFKGKLIHSHSYKTWKGFENQNVVVVGNSASGLEIAVDLAHVCSDVYVSSRSGAWTMRRVFHKGIPRDLSLIKRSIKYLYSWLPFNIRCSLLESSLNSYFDHNLYGLKPKYRVLQQHGIVNDDISNYIVSGRVKWRSKIERFTESGVIFEGINKETKCDAVVFATGYEIWFPFLDSSIVSVINNKVELYKNVFQPTVTHAHTLAFIGLVSPSGPMYPISEMQSRWFAQVITQKTKLPSKEKMLNVIKKDREEREKRFYDSPRHTIEVDFITYLDTIASFINVKPNLWHYIFSDFKLWSALFFGPSLAYQYRLSGPNSWVGARQAILTYYDRMKYPLQYPIRN